MKLRKMLVLSAAVVALSALPALAHHRPNSYCSASGDVCTSTRKVDGKRTLAIGLQERYFNKYRLYVKAPDGSRAWREFRIERMGEGWGDAVRWRRHFPNKGPGAYTVRWRFMNGDPIGPRLGFHRK